MASKHYFHVTLENDAVLRSATAPALNEAVEVNRKTPDQRGAVMCQLIASENGKLILTGSFIEHEYAKRINEILGERKRTSARHTNTGD